MLWAELGDGSSEQAAVALGPGESVEVELRVLTGGAGTGRLIGRIADAATEGPVATAAVSLAGRAREVESDRRGRFVLSGVPAGTHVLRVRRLSYRELRHPVAVTRGHTTEVDVGRVPDAMEIEPLVATVTRSRRLEIKGFYERKYWGELRGGGTFFTAEDIDRRRPSRISHMIADLSGIRLRNNRFFNTRFGGCPVNVYLDNARIKDSVDTLVLPIEIGVVEVYKGPSALPAEFGGADGRCGAVVIWTK